MSEGVWAEQENRVDLSVFLELLSGNDVKVFTPNLMVLTQVVKLELLRFR